MTELLACINLAESLETSTKLVEGTLETTVKIKYYGPATLVDVLRAFSARRPISIEFYSPLNSAGHSGSGD